MTADRNAPRDHALLLILIVAAIPRLAYAPVESFHHPDEIFQYLEQAHRLAAGYGAVPWEYRLGIRSWLLPAALSFPIRLSDALGLDAPAYLLLIRSLLGLLSLSIVASCYRIGHSISALHGVVAGFVGAVWFELVYFSVHPLSEAVALALVAPAAAMLMNVETAQRRTLGIAGFLLGAAFLIRFQMLPFIGTLAILTCGMRVRRTWAPLAAGGLIALGFGAAIDLAMGMIPFSWVWHNFAANIGAGRAATYGVEGPFYYLANFGRLWGVAGIVIAPLALIGARRYPALLAAALVHLLLHSLIAHKEYRFVLVVSAAVVLLAALGSVDMIRWLGRRRGPHAERNAIVAALASWLLISVSLGAGPAFRFQWGENNAALEAQLRARTLPGLCGIATYRVHPSRTGGYTYVHRRVPIYPIDDVSQLAASAPAFNVVLTRPEGTADLPSQYGKVACFEPLPLGIAYSPAARESRTMCIYQRPGGCARSEAPPELNQWLRDHDE